MLCSKLVRYVVVITCFFSISFHNAFALTSKQFNKIYEVYVPTKTIKVKEFFDSKAKNISNKYLILIERPISKNNMVSISNVYDPIKKNFLFDHGDYILTSKFNAKTLKKIKVPDVLLKSLSIKSALEKIEKQKEKVAKITDPKKVCNPIKYFKKRLSNINYSLDYKNDHRKCNDYLENGLSKSINQTKISSKSGPKNGMAQCILRSMKNPIKNRYGIQYGKCNKRRQTVFQLKHPCVTKNYHQVVVDSFKKATKCIGVNEYEFFRIINHESRFHMNIRSHTGVYGIAMMTSGTVGTVNRRISDKMQEYKKRDACKGVMGLLKKRMRLWKKALNACEIIDFPENPLRAFLYGAIYYQLLKEKYEKILNEESYSYLPDEIRRKIAIDFATIAYNGGDWGLRDSFKKYLKNKKVEFVNRDLTYKNVFGEIELDEKGEGIVEHSGFFSYLLENYSGTNGKKGPRRRFEVAKYLGSIRRDAENYRCSADI